MLYFVYSVVQIGIVIIQEDGNMKQVNKDKTDKAQLITKMWHSVHYHVDPVNCGNCEHANQSKWFKTTGECDLVEGFGFPISSLGICRQHSLFHE